MAHHIRDQENQWRSWCLQLVKEHEAICVQHNISLSRPAFIISSSKQKWGSWDHGLNTISISGNLILSQPWDIVIEVLKHEMAHQYVSEKHNTNGHHGPFFLKACEVLSVHPAFQKATAQNNIDIGMLKGELPKGSRKILTKIKKLLALGTSKNEKEAQAASRKANYLLAKYNLSKKDINGLEKEALSYVTITHYKKRLDRLQKAISCTVLKYYFIDTVISYSYDAKRDDTFRSIVLFGTKENLKVAEYVYHYLYRTGRNLWQQYKKEYQAPLKAKISFDMGFTAGITSNLDKLYDTKDITANTERMVLPVESFHALQLKARDQNNCEIKRVFPKLNSRKHTYLYYKSVFSQGFELGEKTILKKGVTVKKNGIQGLLPISGQS